MFWFEFSMVLIFLDSYVKSVVLVNSNSYLKHIADS